MSAEGEVQAPATRVRIEIPPGPQPVCDVVIGPGALRSLGDVLRRHAPASRYAVIADASVASLHGDEVIEAVGTTGALVDLITFPAGESAKTRDTWSALTDALIGRGLGRDGCVIGLGGGVTTDLAGFVAATFMRGVPFVQLPTTLLAMIDASIGGKTGVDTPTGKNLVGVFSQPRAVLIDPRLLATLPDSELRAGLAEAVKHGAIADAGYLERIVESSQALLARDADTLSWLIHRSVEIKAAIVQRDPEERGERAALNFGHTIGHALERLSGFRLLHGFAVAAGMIIEAELGEVMRVTDPGTADTLRSALVRLALPVSVAESYTAKAILDAAATDKKARSGRVRVTLLRRIGEVARDPNRAWTFAVDDAPLGEALARAACASAH